MAHPPSTQPGWKNWADEYIIRLQAGETIKISVQGNSMWPILMPGSTFTLEPVSVFAARHPEWRYPMAGRCVLVRARNVYLHRVADVCDNGLEVWYHIANAGGNNGIRSNGWVQESDIYGVVVGYEPPANRSPHWYRGKEYLKSNRIKKLAAELDDE